MELMPPVINTYSNTGCVLKKFKSAPYLFISVSTSGFKNERALMHLQPRCECSSLIWIYITMGPLETTGAYVTGVVALWRRNKGPDRVEANNDEGASAANVFSVARSSFKLKLLESEMTRYRLGGIGSKSKKPATSVMTT